MTKKERVYVVTRKDKRTVNGERVVYVGRTNDFDRRLKEHERSGRVRDGDLLWKSKQQSPSKIRQVEAGLIRGVRPERNRKEEPVRGPNLRLEKRDSPFWGALRRRWVMTEDDE